MPFSFFIFFLLATSLKFSTSEHPLYRLPRTVSGSESRRSSKSKEMVYKKLIVLAMALSMVLGVSAFAQDTRKLTIRKWRLLPR